MQVCIFPRKKVLVKIRLLKNWQSSRDATAGMSLRSKVPLSKISMRETRAILVFQDPGSTSVNWLVSVRDKLWSTKSMNLIVEIMRGRNLMLLWNIQWIWSIQILHLWSWTVDRLKSLPTQETIAWKYWPTHFLTLTLILIPTLKASIRWANFPSLNNSSQARNIYD